MVFQNHLVMLQYFLITRWKAWLFQRLCSSGQVSSSWHETSNFLWWRQSVSYPAPYTSNNPAGVPQATDVSSGAGCHFSCCCGSISSRGCCHRRNSWPGPFDSGHGRAKAHSQSQEVCISAHQLVDICNWLKTISAACDSHAIKKKNTFYKRMK